MHTIKLKLTERQRNVLLATLMTEIERAERDHRDGAWVEAQREVLSEIRNALAA
jgi:hypothetical protein